MGPDKPTQDQVFALTCDALAMQAILPAKERRKKTAIAARASLEAAAIAMVKSQKDDECLQKWLKASVLLSQSTELALAFPGRPANSLMHPIHGPERLTLARTAPAAFLDALHSRGVDLKVFHGELVLRAIRKNDAALQDFLLEHVEELFSGFRWLLKVKRADLLKSPEFLSAYLRAAAAAHPRNASRSIAASAAVLDGVNFILLDSAGAEMPPPGAAFIPTLVQDVLATLSNHKRLKLFPHGRDIAAFCRDDAALDRAEALFQPKVA